MRILRNRRERGVAFVTTFILLVLVTLVGVTYLDRATFTMRQANRQSMDVQTTHLCEAGVQSVLRSLWRPFKVSQNFNNIDAVTTGSTSDSPTATVTGTVPGVGRFSAGVIRMSQPAGDSYTRIITVRSVGWLDRDNDSALDPGEPRKVVDVAATYQLARSQVFDYTYFVNNYGWMSGFSESQLIVQGDMRANGNFDFTGGTPTVNGSVFASVNDKLIPPAVGLVNQMPVKWTNANYATQAAANPGNAADNQMRWRQSFTSGTHGTKGSAQFENWRDLIFDSVGSIVNNRIAGSVLGDSQGVRSFDRTSGGSAGTANVIDARATDEVIMPDLSDISYYTAMSQAYINPRTTFSDGTVDPNAGSGAYIEVWDQTLNAGAGAYKRITTNGVITGSAVIVGTATRPIRIHGPVTITQDAVIKGDITGQGTIYTGRNVHIVGSIRYRNKPNFRGSNLTTIDNFNEKQDMLGLAARGSVMMGNIKAGDLAINYMRPPFTKARLDESGNTIPAFDATQLDSGQPRYRTVVSGLADSFYESINQIDAVLYTNFVGGGNVGTGGGGIILNGSIISKDEAMIVWSLPMRMNYDSRIRERALTQKPLIDIALPRSPVMLRSSWQDRGFGLGN